MPARTVPQAPAFVPSAHAHPFGRYPFASRTLTDADYVGPAWAAPAPRHVPAAVPALVPAPAPLRARPWAAAPSPAPARRTGVSGCVVGAIVAVVVAVLGGVAVVVLAVVGLKLLADRGVRPIPTARPVPTTSAPLPLPVVAPTTPPAVRAAYTTGTCREVSTERADDEYDAMRDAGSAPRLIGRVAILHVRLGGGASAWPRSLVVKLDEAALLMQTFYLDQARRHAVHDLRVDVIPWPLPNAPLAMPPIATDRSRIIDEPTKRRLRDESMRAIEAAFGASLESVVATYRAKGYAAVAFLLYLPVRSQARDFAMPAYGRSDARLPEAAILVSYDEPLSEMSVTVAHEGLHLFGADDLYRMRAADPRDAHDVMGEYCRGFKQAVVGDATAYAVGWTDRKPARAYRIVDR